MSNSGPNRYISIKTKQTKHTPPKKKTTKTTNQHKNQQPTNQKPSNHQNPPQPKPNTIEMNICFAMSGVDSWSFSDFTRKLK